MGILASHYYVKPSFCEEEQIKDAIDEEEEESLIDIKLDNFTELTGENIEEVMENTESKFIYYYDKEKTDPKYMEAVNNHANRMINGLKCKCYALDVQKYGENLKEYLSTRKMSSKLEDEIDNN